MRPTLALLALLALAGCSTTYDLTGSDWNKPGTTIQNVTLDEMECVRGTRDAGRTLDLVLGGLLDVGRFVVEEGQRKGSYASCMTAKGYQPS